MEEDRSGALLASKYRLERLLGSGGMGQVYRATNELIGREVAIKMLRRELASSPEVIERFLREARAANLVRHPNVVDVLDVGQDDQGVPFIVQELLEGEDLACYAEKHGGKIELEEVVGFLCPIIDAVAEAHAKGVVHRDIKPENVFLAEGAKEIVPKLLDFGISKIDKKGIRTTQTGIGMGTPAYMPPEQLKGAKDADARSDVWAIGIMLFEMIAGRLPFDASDAPALFVSIATEDAPKLIDVSPQVPADLSRIVERCIRRDPKDRYPSAAELARDLRLVILGLDIKGTQVGSLPPARTKPTPPRVELPRAPMPPKDTVLAPTPIVAPDLDIPAPRPSVPKPKPVVAQPVARAPQPVAPLDGVMLGPTSTPQVRSATPYDPNIYRGGQSESSGDASGLVGGAVVAATTIVILAVLTIVARTAEGWQVVRVALPNSPDVVMIAQGILALIVAAIAVTSVRSAYKSWTGTFDGGPVRALLLAGVAAVAFFAAIELLRGAT